jgi:hypothetical protein
MDLRANKETIFGEVKTFVLLCQGNCSEQGENEKQWQFLRFFFDFIIKMI